MSKAAAAPADGEKPKGKGKLIIIIVAVVVLLAAAGGAYFFLFKKGHGEEAEGGEHAKEKPKAEKKHKADPGKPPTYVPLERFTVNLKPENGEQFLQTDILVKVDDAKEGDKLKAFSPEIRNDVIMLLSGKKPSEVLDRDGREQLADEIKDAVNSIVGTPGRTDKKGRKTSPDGPVEKVIFSSFIIQ